MRRMKLITADSVDELFTETLFLFREGIGSVSEQWRDEKELSYFDFSLRLPDDPTSPDAGKQVLETSITYQLSNPRNRLVFSKSMDIFNYVGLWNYLLSGSPWLHPIEFYNPIARNFVDPAFGTDLLRGNWGERIFDYSSYRIESSPIERIIQLLKEHPSTRRAVLPVFLPTDIGIHSRNLPCLTSIQFLITDGKLDCFTTMRSQAVYGVLPYDLFLLTMLHEYVATQLDVELGSYTHFCPSAVLRPNEIKGLLDVLDHSYSGIGLDHLSMPPMPKLSAKERVTYLTTEGWLRQGGTVPVNSINEAELGAVPAYWRSFLQITHVKYVLEHGEERAPVSWPELLLKAGQLNGGAFPEELLYSAEVRISDQQQGR